MNLQNPELINMPIKGVYIFKADSGITLYSNKKVDVQEDLFSAFLAALKGFFQSFELGGLSSFSSNNYIFYIATANNVLTSLVIDTRNKSDKFFNLAYQISVKFYEKYKIHIDSKSSIHIPGKSDFDLILGDIIENFQSDDSIQQELINLYKINNSGDLQTFEFINEDQLSGEDLFLAVNLVTKKIFIVENTDKDVSSRKLFLANKSASQLNQSEYKSEFQISNVSDPWDFERIIEMITKLLRRESIAF